MMATFQDRLKQLVGPKGYEPVMRRSIQSIVMFEAQRCIQEKLPSLRPFQRKIAHFNQLLALLETLDFIPANLRKEVLWRTGTSKEAMNNEIAWKRSRAITKELAKIAMNVQPLVNMGMSHTQACDAIVQEQYESTVKESKGSSTEETASKERPALWEHSHNHLMMAYRLYYKGDKLDPDFPPPCPPVAIVVPAERPQGGENGHFVAASGASGNPVTDSVGGGIQQLNTGPGAERQRLLSEVREHLDLLKEFEGVIPQEDLNERKRELFLALPPAPPPAHGKRMKTE